MLIEQTSHVVDTLTGPMTIYLIKPKIAEYPNAKFPGVIVWSEMFVSLLFLVALAVRLIALSPFQISSNWTSSKIR